MSKMQVPHFWRIRFNCFILPRKARSTQAHKRSTAPASVFTFTLTCAMFFQGQLAEHVCKYKLWIYVLLAIGFWAKSVQALYVPYSVFVIVCRNLKPCPVLHA